MSTVSRWAGHSLLVAVATLASACADNAPVAPTGPKSATGIVADVTYGHGLPDLTACPTLGAPEGSVLKFHGYGIGFQVYHWNGTSWGAATPDAKIFADPGGHGQVATHFAGPSWRSNSGSTVVGTVLNRCTPDAASIAWLSLSAVHSGHGLFADVNFIQRLNTVGGNPPSTPGALGQEARVPYTADYLFYRAP